jgi:superfamily II DNA/RNA helicase
VHRIERTGRAGSTGEALSLVCSEDRPLLSAIERLINKKIEARNADGFDRGFDRGERSAPAPQGERQQHRPKQHAPKEHASREHAPKQHAPKQHAPKQHAPKHEHRDARGDRRPKREPLPDFFAKPYEPSTTAASPAPAEQSGRKRPAAPVPALFRKKAA